MLELKRCNVIKSHLPTDLEVVNGDSRVWRNSLPFELIQQTLLKPNSDVSNQIFCIVLRKKKRFKFLTLKTF